MATVTADTSGIANGSQVDADDISTCINNLRTFINDGTADTNNYATNKSDICITFAHVASLTSASTFKFKVPASISNFTVIFGTAYVHTMATSAVTVQVDKKSGGATTTMIATSNLTVGTALTVVSTSTVASGTLAGGDEIHVILTPASGSGTGEITVTIWAQATHRVAE